MCYKTYWIARFLPDAFGFITDVSAGTRVHSIPHIVQLLFHLAAQNIYIVHESEIFNK